MMLPPCNQNQKRLVQDIYDEFGLFGFTYNDAVRLDCTRSMLESLVFREILEIRSLKREHGHGRIYGMTAEAYLKVADGEWE